MESPESKFPVGGIRLSDELIQLRLLAGSMTTVLEVFQRLADRRVNLMGVALDFREGRWAGT